MRDKRPVDELSIEELERILAIRKREARQAQLHRLSMAGRRVVPPGGVPDPEAQPLPVVAARPPAGNPPPVDAPNGDPDGVPAFEEGAPRFEDDYIPATRGQAAPPAETPSGKWSGTAVWSSSRSWPSWR